MHGNIPFGVASAREIARQQLRDGDKIVGRWNFGPVAKYLWPDKTAAHLASISGSTERTAERWLAGDHDPPYAVIEATMHKIFVRK